MMTAAEYRELRARVGTQQEVADLLGVTRQLISSREQAGSRISLEAGIALRELARTTAAPSPSPTTTKPKRKTPKQ